MVWTLRLKNLWFAPSFKFFITNVRVSVYNITITLVLYSAVLPGSDIQSLNTDLRVLLLKLPTPFWELNRCVDLSQSRFLCFYLGGVCVKTSVKAQTAKSISQTLLAITGEMIRTIYTAGYAVPKSLMRTRIFNIKQFASKLSFIQIQYSSNMRPYCRQSNYRVVNGFIVVCLGTVR